MVVFGKVVFFGQKWLYSGKVVVFVQSGSIRTKWLNSSKNEFIRAKLLYSVKVVVLGQKWLYWGNKWLHSGKSVCLMA